MSKAVERFVLAVLMLLCQTALVQADKSAELRRRSLQTYQQDVRPLLKRYCANCHGPEKQEAKIRLDVLNPDMATGADAETWHDALNKLNLDEMPPEEATQPKAKERETIVNWMTAELKRAVRERRSTGGRVVMRRLTRYEYANTLRDLLGLGVDFAEDLPAERNSPDGLKNNGSLLQMSPQQIEAYVETARKAIAKTIVTGDRPEVFKYANSLANSRKGPLHPPNAGTAVFPKYPMEGEFRIRVQVSVQATDNADGATMQVVMGVRPSPKNLKTKSVGVAKVTGDKNNPQTFEFRGRMENFPRHDPNTAYRERRFPGLQVGFWNMSHDQSPAKKSKRNKRSRKAKKNKRGKKNKTVLKKVDTTTSAGPVLTIHSVSFEGPIYQAWPPGHHTRILFQSDLAAGNEREYARQVLERFMRRAFRRPVSAKEVERKLKVYDELRSSLPSLAATMRELLPEVLVAHDFLYLSEPTDAKQPQPLSDYELASRLSYFLWSTMPDDKLFALAQSGKLHDPKTASRQVRAMLKDKRSWSFVENFTDQWLNLSALGRVAINPDYYPTFDNRLKGDMRKETQHFFAEILNKELSAMNFIDSEFAMLNRPLAEHYGIAGPRDHAFVRVSLKPDDHRGGLLGQGSILLSNSSGDDSHPIYRGVFIRDRLLGDAPASPPPDVPDLKQDDPAFETLTLRKQLEVHRQKESCNSCHKNIDPWGIPLENFDAVGRWRTEILKATGKGTPPKFVNGVARGKRKRPSFLKLPVESDSTLPSGQKLSGLPGLKEHLLKHEQKRFSRALVSRLLAYGLGRSLEFADSETVDSLCATFEESNYQLDELIVAITNSRPFKTK